MLEPLIDWLLAHTSVTDIAGDRIRPLIRDQGDNPPFVVLTPIGGRPEYTLVGQTRLSRRQLQVDSYATTWSEADLLNRAVKAVLSGKAFTRMGVDFRPLTITNEQSLFDEADPTARLYREMTEYRVWHTDP